MSLAKMMWTAALALAVAAAPAGAQTRKQARMITLPKVDIQARPAAQPHAQAQARSHAQPRSQAQPPSQAQPRAQAEPDSAMTLRGGQAGTDFRTMTVEGEDRVHIDFGRPQLDLDLNPQDVPGLQRGTAADVLDRTVPDLTAPLLSLSSQERSPYLARPWLRQFASGSVARFQPAVKGVEQWKLTIADSRGQTVASYEGKGDPPREIVWDGHSQSGAPVTPGITYSYVFEARDRAGNKRNFVGQGFTISAYRLDGATGPVLVLSGKDLAPPQRGAAGYGPGGAATGISEGASREGTSALLLEAASWLNQSTKVREPVRVTVAARSLERANALAARAREALADRVIGGPARIQTFTEVAADAPEDGVLRIGLVK